MIGFNLKTGLLPKEPPVISTIICEFSW